MYQENMDREGGEALEDVVEQQEELEDVYRDQEYVDREGEEPLDDVTEYQEQFEAVHREQEFEN